jgi:predicted dehydrogenase
MNASSYRRILGANDRVNVGIVGFSDRAKNTLIPCFKNHSEGLNFDIIALSDVWSVRRAEGAKYLEDSFGKPVKGYINNEELYRNKDIDAVIISTADFQHALHAIEAAENGKDAYLEKPFAETMEDNRRARAAIDKSGIVLQIGSQRRSGTNYHAANEFIRSGKFGDIVMVEMTSNVNQPGRWRRPKLVAQIRREDVDWTRFLMNRPYHEWDPRIYLEYRLFWPFSSGIPGQWMCHQIDTVHWFTGYSHPRTVAVNGGIYLWKDGRTNYDTMTAVMEYGPSDDVTKGFQVLYSSRFTNSVGGVKEIYYSNAGELNLDTNKVTPNGGLAKADAEEMGMKANMLPEFTLDSEERVVTSANTGGDRLTSMHMRNWMECVRSRKQPNAPVSAGYNHAIACIMVNAAVRTREFVRFDDKTQEVMAGSNVFKY